MEFLTPHKPALILAPMDGLTDSPMRAVQGDLGAFTWAVSEFLRVSGTPIPTRVFHREVPELLTDAKTVSGLPVQVQILGGDPDLMAESALNAVSGGALAIDINFGCPAPTVNRHDGGASILRCPPRVADIVKAVREAVPESIPVSAKLRLGWEHIDEIHQTARMAALGGADWLVIHARTKMQKYHPPVFWKKIGEVRRELSIPIVANGDIWTLDDFFRCQEETGCDHFMLGRGALVDPTLSPRVARALGLPYPVDFFVKDWMDLLLSLSLHSANQPEFRTHKTLHRLKQWLNLASRFGGFDHFEKAKACPTQTDLFSYLGSLKESGLFVAKPAMNNPTLATAP